MTIFIEYYLKNFGSQPILSFGKKLREHVFKKIRYVMMFLVIMAYSLTVICSQLIMIFSYYYYKEDNDYGEVKIGLTKNNDLTSIVSADDSNLTLFMKNEKLKSFFESKGYATSFDKSRYILLPVVFNNIYKGSLGEAIGKYCLSEIGYKLEEIEDSMLYEKFDYKYKNCYIDFKNWNDRGQSLDVEHSKISLKQLKVIWLLLSIS